MEKTNFCIPKDETTPITGLLKEYRPHNKAIYRFSITPDRKYVISGSLDKSIKIWNLETGELYHNINGHDDEITSIDLSSDGSRIVSGSEDSTVKLWKLDTGNLMRNFTFHDGAIFDVLITPNDEYIISTSEDKYAKITKWTTKKILRSLKEEDQGLKSIAMSPDGKILAISSGKNIFIWNWGEIEPKDKIKAHKFTISSIKICPKGEYLISSSLDKTIKIWNLKSGELIKVLEGHKGGVNSIAISYDRRYIASGSGDKTVIVWDTINGKQYGPFAHESYVQCVKFIPTSYLVLGADYNGSVRVWDFLGECIDLKSGLQRFGAISDIAEDFSKNLTIFISYATADTTIYEIQRIANILSTSYPDIEKVLFWEENMDDDIYVYMNDNLAIADVVLVFCSKNANDSEAVRTEWMVAHKMKKKIIPVFTEEKYIPPLLTTKLGIKYKSSDIKGFIQELYTLIKKKTKPRKK
ncbi:MAG: TIR domain-containing protein [Candidatus Lokiarchaeota archaeon]|nr:TIR domain-containing protein [Candidatus Lokiarchaeota archaeon]